MQGGWQPPPGGGGYGAPPQGGGYGQPPQGGGYGQPPPGGAPPGYGAPPPSMGFAPNPYGAPQGAPGMMSGSFGNYEFNETENQIVDKTASRAKLWGVISIVVGSLNCVSSCGGFAKADLFLNLPSGIVGIIVGVAFLGVGNSLKQVVQTQGNDLMHMMQALQKMSSAFMVQIVCTIAGWVLGALVLAGLVFLAVAIAASQ